MSAPILTLPLTPQTEAERLEKLCAKYGLLRPSDVDRICAEDENTQFLVDGFLPSTGIAMVAGDSTIGKSPFVYQLCLSVATGKPFLGRPVRQGRVIYFDLENSTHDARRIRDLLQRHLGLDEVPEYDFLLKHERPPKFEDLIRDIRPALVVIDSLRSCSPGASDKNKDAGTLLNMLKGVSRECGNLFLVVHHVKKTQGKNGEDVLNDPLDHLSNSRVTDWMQQMEGARALMNQSDVRIAVEGGDCNAVALRVKWNMRTRGDSPLVSLERVFDEEGEAIGYKHLAGVDWLTGEHRTVFGLLPAEFSFKQAREALKKGDEMTNQFLKACLSHGLIEKKPGKFGGYRKLA